MRMYLYRDAKINIIVEPGYRRNATYTSRGRITGQGKRGMFRSCKSIGRLLSLEKSISGAILLCYVIFLGFLVRVALTQMVALDRLSLPTDLAIIYMY